LTVAAALPVLAVLSIKKASQAMAQAMTQAMAQAMTQAMTQVTKRATAQDTPTPLEPPFDHAVKFNVNDLISPNRLTKLTVQFIATLDNNFERKSPEHFFDSPNFPSATVLCDRQKRDRP
jgi:hypothetical protein